MTIPMGAFLLLLGIYWQPNPISRKERKLQARLDVAQGVTPELPASTTSDTEKPKLTSRQVQRYLRLLGERAALIGFGSFAILVGAIDDLGKLEDRGAFLALFGLYAGMIVLVQRTEQRRKLLVFWLMGIAALLTWGRAQSRGVAVEGDWAVLAALGVNFLFWLLVNRRFPPGSSDVIEVYGME
ncbi:MAG: hypothetical protein HY862_07255 [Chloroflexi bacterium]|nr:hypothetical protein [Chloroflexota bacterium]